MAKGIKTGGRVAGTPNKVTAEIKEVARAYGPGAIERLAKLAGLAGRRYTAQAEAAQVAALKELLDRGYGKPTQPLSSDEAAPFVVQMIERRVVHADNRDR